MPTHEIARLCCLREWIEVFYRQAKGELDWHDWQVRQDRAILRHWHLIFGAYTFVLLHGLAQAPAQKMLVQLTRLRWMAWTVDEPPPTLAALLAHVQASRHFLPKLPD